MAMTKNMHVALKDLSCYFDTFSRSGSTWVMMVSLDDDRRYVQKIGLIVDLNMQIKKCPSFFTSS